MCSNSGERKSVEKFLSELDPELEKYAPYLRKMGFTSNTMLRFLKLKDLQGIECIVPTAHRRMLLNAVAKLQSPESKLAIESPRSDDMPKKKQKTDGNVCDSPENATGDSSISRSGTLEPKKLFSEGQLPEQHGTDSVYDILVRQKLELEEKLAKCKVELAEFTTPPAQLMPLAIHGNRIMSVMCTRCHHRGHRKDGNKNGVSYEFEVCPGYHYCGHEKFHPEFKTERREVILLTKTFATCVNNKRKPISCRAKKSRYTTSVYYNLVTNFFQVHFQIFSKYLLG